MTADELRTTRNKPAAQEARREPAIDALVELCEAQQATITKLRRAIEEHRRQGTPRAALEGLAHEVATPLTAIIGFLQLATGPRASSEQKAEFVQRALRQSEILHRVVADLVDLAGGDVADVRTPTVRVRLADVVADAMEVAWPRIHPRRIEVDVSTAVSISTVPARVQQILVNLLVNAGRHSPADSPIRVAGHVDADNVVLEVGDRGPGVDWAEVEELFRPFRRGRRVARVPGLGLGLYLVRLLAESLEGCAVLVPRAGGGAIARVVLPQRRLGDTAVP